MTRRRYENPVDFVSRVMVNPADPIREGKRLDRAMAAQVSAFRREHGVSRLVALGIMQDHVGRIAADVGASEGFVRAWIDGELRRA